MDERLRFVARLLEGEKMAPNRRAHATRCGGDPSDMERRTACGARAEAALR